MEISKKKPVTMITGYLGSGKTTVLNELLKTQTEMYGIRFARSQKSSDVMHLKK